MDCTSATIECIGGGGTSGGGYSRTNSLALTPGAFAFINIGSGSRSGGGTTQFSVGVFPPTSTANGCKATGGGGIYGVPNGTTGNVGGGAAVDGIGDVRYDGGGSRVYRFSGEDDITEIIYSFGGAAGPNGAGGNGLLSGSTYGGGGGANGGGGGTNILGGNNRFGTGGGANAGGNGSNGGGGGPNGVLGSGAGSFEPIYTDTFTGLTYGPCGGAGGTSSGAGTASPVGGLGGGATGGNDGAIIFTYTPITLTPGTKTETFAPPLYPNPYSFDWIPPEGATNVKLEAIGNANSGRGGAYVSSTISGAATPLGIFCLNGSNNISASNASGTIIRADPNGLAGSSIGTIKYSGGAAGASSAYSYCCDGNTYFQYLSGGGGGAAGPDGPGGAGGNANPTYSGGGSCQGGGGGGGASSPATTAGGDGTATVGGVGGSCTGGTGGTGGVSCGGGGEGSNGGGGGGGTYAAGGAGSQRNIYTDSFTGLTYGPRGGGGGWSLGASPGGGGSSGENGSAGVLIISYTIPATGSTGNMLMMFR